MKKILVIFLILAATVGVCAGIGYALTGYVTQPRIAQLLADGDMEATGTTSWSAGGSGAVLSKETGSPHSGKRVLRVTAPATGEKDAFQTVVTNGKKYRVSGWGRCDGSTNRYFAIYLGNSNRVYLGTSSNSWQRFDVSGVSDGSILYLYTYSATDLGYCEFDDVYLTEDVGYVQVQNTQIIVDGDMEGRPMALVNGSFEGAAGPPPNGWTQLNSSATRVAGVRTNGVGSYVAQLAYSGSSIGYLYQYCSLAIGNTYRVTGWARSVDGVAVPAMRDTSAGGLVWDGTNSTSWQYFDYVGVAQSTGLMMKATSLGVGGAVQFDDLSVVDVGSSAWTAYAATHSKRTDTPKEGRQYLRITADGSMNNAYAIQNVLTAGKKYRVTGWARSDGSRLPQIFFGGSYLAWQGTNSTSWQRVDAIGTALGSGTFYLGEAGYNSGYTEFDGIMITEYKGEVGVIDKQIITDGDMEMSGTTYYTPGNNATLSKSTSAHGGKYALRVAYNGTDNPIAIPTAAPQEGKMYRITGWARGDGSGGIPVVKNGNTTNAWVGTNSNTWQRIDVTYTQGVGNYYYFRMVGSSGYVEFDDMMSTLVN